MPETLRLAPIAICNARETRQERKRWMKVDENAAGSKVEQGPFYFLLKRPFHKTAQSDIEQKSSDANLIYHKRIIKGFFVSPQAGTY